MYSYIHIMLCHTRKVAEGEKLCICPGWVNSDSQESRIHFKSPFLTEESQKNQSFTVKDQFWIDSESHILGSRLIPSPNVRWSGPTKVCLREGYQWLTPSQKTFIFRDTSSGDTFLVEKTSVEDDQKLSFAFVVNKSLLDSIYSQYVMESCFRMRIL